MTEHILVRLFEHNNWANSQMIEACVALPDEQLDAAPQSAALGTIRLTLFHLVVAQHGYLALLTLPFEARIRATPSFGELQQVARISGEGLLALARDEHSDHLKTQLRTKDGYVVEPWVVMVQAINHATEHREQISSMFSALGVTPPAMHGWAYGEVANAVIPVSE